MNRTSDMFGGRPQELSAKHRARAVLVLLHYRIFGRKTGFQPHLREGRLFLKMLQPQAAALANRIFIPVEIAMMDTDNREPKS
jgi:hypothetical protein